MLFDHDEARGRDSSQGLLYLFVGLSEKLGALLVIRNPFLNQLVSLVVRQIAIVLRVFRDGCNPLVVQFGELRVVIAVNGTLRNPER